MTTARALPRRATYADLEAVPSHKVAEILGGELVVSPRPAIPHAMASSSVGGTLIPPFQFGGGGPGGWWIFFEPELHFDDDVLVPDLAGWRRSRMPAAPQTPAISLPPDWICEVVSPGTASADRVRKLPIYSAQGVPHAWLVDPLARTLEVLRLQDGRWIIVGTHGGDEIVRAEPFDAIALDLLVLWGETRPASKAERAPRKPRKPRRKPAR
jgi:hypothetical protein